MLVTYKNNRSIPALIIALCFVLFYCLFDPSLENYGYKPAAKQKGTVTGQRKLLEPDAEPDAVGTPAKAKTAGKAVVSSYKGLSTDDVLLIVKTGGTTMWKRMLVHLATTLSHDRIPLANTAIYSDLPEQIGPFTVIDVLANMSAAAKAKPDFDVYRQQPEYMAHNYYVEAAGISGDEWGPTGGWIIDKYKFIPLIQHAGDNWPEAKWYIYTEDDTYLFLPGVLRHLAEFDWTRPHYLGGFAAKSDVIFAHGGSGFALSRGAWEQSFGRQGNRGGGLAEEYYQYTADHCCGDQVLAHALRKHGVRFGENGGDGKFTFGFNSVVHWDFAFSRANWCRPLLSWHKVHNRDVARYYDLERRWDWSKGPLLYRDFFRDVILPGVKKHAQWWDNRSGAFEVSSGTRESAPAPAPGAGGGSYDEVLWSKAWESVEACEAACKGWTECMQWNFVEDLCKMDDRIFMGQGYAPAMSQRKTALMHTSGWMYKRLERWTC
ncbi:glycosyltransferase family 31 protein [Trichoderma cornu-damae]|uniref:Glycosyltransferase family 31 protein n=1 Tax=Trichoderma cornu-damae TaxID=654480 RepID=A0A9P8QGE6_9HYPO|nr:glycosyltransferase family 31 protein [Trichoderma cornu-damae]